jgi:hypothetical protein
MNKYPCNNFFLQQKLKYMVSLIQLKPILEISFPLQLSSSQSETPLAPISLSYTYISNIGNTPTTGKDIIPHKKIKKRKAHNNCLRKTSNNSRRKTKVSTAHSSITTTLIV